MAPVKKRMALAVGLLLCAGGTGFAQVGGTTNGTPLGHVPLSTRPGMPSTYPAAKGTTHAGVGSPGAATAGATIASTGEVSHSPATRTLPGGHTGAAKSGTQNR